MVKFKFLSIKKIILFWVISISFSLNSMDYIKSGIKNVLPILNSNKFHALCSIYIIAKKIYDYNQINKTMHYKNASPEVDAWCRNILKEHNIDNCEQIKFKVNDTENESWHTCIGNTIFMGTEEHNNLQMVLSSENNDFKTKTLATSEFAILHEMKHIKSKDVILRSIYSLLISFISSKIFTNSPQLISNKILSNLNELLPTLIALILITKYMHYQELQADKFAISKINDIKKIDIIIDFYDEHYGAELRSFVLSTKPPFPNLFTRLVYLFFKLQHKLTTEGTFFGEWLKQRPSSLNLIHWTFDSTHPSFIDRIKPLEERKKELLKLKEKAPGFTQALF
ncbi:MAG: M48 family metalloprotease [Candidatus Babeliales bacterium]|nr:M48 family metalloprotease [Candidatus Babeliales bacterium]